MTWRSAPTRPALDPHVLHVWKIVLTPTDNDELVQARQWLSPNEKERADRYVVEPPRTRFTMARAGLRRILSQYTGIAPDQLIFASGPHGKPHLNDHTLQFNLSHSGLFALLAVMRHQPVGIDIEQMNPSRAGESIAARFFSSAEQMALSNSPDKVAGFFRLWSRKEAVIKTLGEGLACPLDSFDVSMDAHEAKLIAFRREGIDVNQWTMLSIHVDADYAAAAAIIGPCRNVIGYQL